MNTDDKWYLIDYKGIGIAKHLVSGRQAVLAWAPSKPQGERLVAMLNDVPIKGLMGHAGYGDNDEADDFRMVETLKLFCLQENLTYADLGLNEFAIRNANQIYERGLDERNKRKASSDGRKDDNS